MTGEGEGRGEDKRRKCRGGEKEGEERVEENKGWERKEDMDGWINDQKTVFKLHALLRAAFRYLT